MKLNTGKISIVTMITAGLLLAGCGKQDDKPASSTATSAQTQAQAKSSIPTLQPQAVPRSIDMAQLARGGNLFQKNCAACHGSNAEGAPNWQKPGPDGKYPPPPLNGTAHAWHHPMEALKRTIRDGTLKLGGNMPAWGDKLSVQDMEDVIAWFQAKWPDELYAAWYHADQRAQQQGR